MEKRKSKRRRIARKAIVVFVLIIIVIYVIPYMDSRIRSYRNKNKIVSIVKDNPELLNNSVKNGSYKEALRIDGIKNINFFETDKGNIYIDYFCN